MGGSIKHFIRRMGQDLRDTLKGIGSRGHQHGRGGDTPREVTGDGNATQTPQGQLSIDGIPQQLQNITAAVHLLLEGYMQLNEKHDRNQHSNSLTLQVVKTMMKRNRTEMYDTPRLACLLVPWDFALLQGLSPEEQNPKNWIRRLVDGGASKTRGWFRKNVRLFLVCARTFHLVPCGPEGHGYMIQQFRTWTKIAVGVMKVMVQLTSTVLGASASSDLSSYLLDAAEGSLRVAEGDGVSSLKTYLRGSTGRSVEVVHKVSMQSLEMWFRICAHRKFRTPTIHNRLNERTAAGF